MSITTNGLVGESVRVVTTAGFVGRSTAVLLGSARRSDVETVGVSVVVVDGSSTTDEGIEQVTDERSFDGASSDGTVVARVDLSAFFGDGEAGTTDGGGVRDFPRDAGSAFIFGISHSAFITIVQDLAHLINGIDGLTFTSAVVFIEVAPASVFVQSIDGIAHLARESSGDIFRLSTQESGEGLVQTELSRDLGSNDGRESEHFHFVVVQVELQLFLFLIFIILFF